MNFALGIMDILGNSVKNTTVMNTVVVISCVTSTKLFS